MPKTTPNRTNTDRRIYSPTHGYLDGYDGEKFEWTLTRKTSWIMSQSEANRRIMQVQKTAPDATVVSLGHVARESVIDSDTPTDVVPVTATVRKVEGEQGSDPTLTDRTSVLNAGTKGATTPRAGCLTTQHKSVLPATRFPAVVRPPHVVVIARAGTGKTTTLVCGLQALRGEVPGVDVLVDPLDPSKGKRRIPITPSPQQRAVWDAILLSKDRCRSVCFAAFNKTIADELESKVPPGCEASTLHRLGYRAVRKRYGNDVEMVKTRVKNIVLRLLKTDEQTLRDDDPLLLSRVEQLVSLCKVNLASGSVQELYSLCDRFDIDFGDTDGSQEAFERAEALRGRVFDLVPRVLESCRNVSLDRCIDYDDMIWIPVVNELTCWRNDLLLVDEAQDMNRCQQAMAMKCGERLVLCGDDKQAIYGFAGADSESIPNMIQRLKAGRGCTVLPLTVTRRCGKAIVKEANKYVPDFEAHESNGEGEVKTANYPKGRGSKSQVEDDKTYLPLVRPGDMIVSRANAPLVSQCFKILKRGIPAFIVGKADVAKSLTSLITKMDAATVPELVRKLEEWAAREIEKEESKKEPNEGKIERVRDRRDCALAFCEDMETVKDVLRRVDRLFEVVQDAVRLSSVHRAKGLESARVFFLAPGGFRPRHPKTQEWEWQQEMNLRYVGITRAIKELIYVC